MPNAKTAAAAAMHHLGLLGAARVTDVDSNGVALITVVVGTILSQRCGQFRRAAPDWIAIA
jgi:hypothetical protein